MATTSGIFWFMLQLRYMYCTLILENNTFIHQFCILCQSFPHYSLVVGSIYLFSYFYIQRDNVTKLDCFRELLRISFVPSIPVGKVEYFTSLVCICTTLRALCAHLHVKLPLKMHSCAFTLTLYIREVFGDYVCVCVCVCVCIIFFHR